MKLFGYIQLFAISRSKTITLKVAENLMNKNRCCHDHSNAAFRLSSTAICKYLFGAFTPCIFGFTCPTKYFLRCLVSLEKD